MPTYLFHCLSCREDHETIVSISERDTSQECPSCKKPTSLRVFEPTIATIVPAWMSATRSEASERQAKYLQSDEHRKSKAHAERMQDRAQAAQDKYEHFKTHILPDKVEQKKAEAAKQ